MHKFKDGKGSILVATDLASRGLDIPAVELVVNFDLPRNPVDYIHRVGRTARAGRGGTSLSFVTQSTVKLLYAIEEFTTAKLDKYPKEDMTDEILEQATHYT